MPMPGYDVRILHDDGSECETGEEGAICVQLPLPPGTLPTLWSDDERYVGVVPVGIPATTSPATAAASTRTATCS